MFIPPKKEKRKELLLELPNYYEEYQNYIQKKEKENKKETVIHIQIY
jgi:hypothetical protein